MATITHKVIFDLDNSKIKIEDLTDYTSGYSGNIHGVVTITKNGSAFNTPGTSGSPDITVLSTDYSPTSPVQSSRKFEIAFSSLSISDVWAFDYTVYPNAGSGGAESATQINFTYSFTEPTVSLGLVASTNASQITSTDSTDYTSSGAYTLISQTRTHQLYPPQGAVDASTGALLPSPVDSGSNSTITYTGITTGVWTSDSESVLEYSLAGNSGSYYILTTITGFANTNVVSDIGLCDVYCCLKALNLRYEDAKCKNKSLAVDYKDKIEEVTRLVTLYRQALDCGNTSDAEVYLNDIKNVSECSTECNCYGGGAAPANLPITSSVSSNSYQLTSNSPNISIRSSGSGTSADPVTYEMELGAEITGDISYIASNMASIESQMEQITQSVNHVENIQNNYNVEFSTQIYHVELTHGFGSLSSSSSDILESSYSSYITSPLVNNKFKSSPSIIRWDGHAGSPTNNFNNWYKMSNLFNSSSSSIDSVVATISDTEDLNIETYNIDNTSFSSFEFRLLDKQTNLPKTVSSLPQKVNITFKIIAK